MTPTGSPRLGSTHSLSATIPSDAASGGIRFTTDSLTLVVSEPDSADQLVLASLTIERNGTYCAATVTWFATASDGSTFTNDDVFIVTSSANS